MNTNRPFYDVLQRWLDNYQAIKNLSPKYAVLANMIIEEIVNGKFNNGDKLPPHRIVADALKISIQTVSSAYRDVEHRGYVRCEVGRGSYVFKQLTEDTAQYIRDSRDNKIIDLSIIRSIYDDSYNDYKNDIFSQLIGEESNQWMHSCRPISGFSNYREIYQEWIKDIYPHASAENLMLINGCTQGVFTALSSVVNADDIVLTENITDHGVIGCSRILRFILKGLPIDEQGIIPEAFEKVCKHEKVKALVCTPTFNNPTNALMGIERRKQIAEIANRHGVFIIEDDIYARLLDKPLPSISSMIPELGFYITSFSKVLFAGARTGFMICPRKYIMRAESVLKVTGWMATPLIAKMVTTWIEQNKLHDLLQLQRRLIKARQKVVKSKLNNNYLQNHHSNSLSVWVTLPEHWQPLSFAKRLFEKNIAVTTSDPFLVNAKASKNAVRICIGGNIPDVEFGRALKKINSLLDNQPSISSSWY